MATPGPVVGTPRACERPPVQPGSQQSHYLALRQVAAWGGQGQVACGLSPHPPFKGQAVLGESKHRGARPASGTGGLGKDSFSVP